MRSKIAYPYTIKPVQIPAGGQSKCDPAAVLEWLRIECLLRSPTVRQLYKERPRHVLPMYTTTTTKTGRKYRKKPTPQSIEFQGGELEELYGIQYGWHILEGHHHELLGNINIDAGAVVDLQVLTKLKPATVQVEEYLLLGDPRFLCLRFNVTVPFYVLQAELKRQYDARQTALPPTAEKVKINLKTWLAYLRWHDWHTINNLSAGQIAKKEEGHGLTFSQVRIERALKKVGDMIKRAEEARQPDPLKPSDRRYEKWPPPAKFLH
jgi:hypothetical protein